MLIKTPASNMEAYSILRSSFKWENEQRNLEGLPDNAGLNMAHESVDRHANGNLCDRLALRWIRKDGSESDFTFLDLKVQSSRFANALTALGISKGETVCTLLGRVPELYITALGTLKKVAVFCPLFSGFGPEPVFQRLSIGKVKILVTTLELYQKKIRDNIEKLPDLKHVLIIDIGKNLDDTVLSLPFLMAKMSGVFKIPFTSPHDHALLHFTSDTADVPKGALQVHGAVVMHYVTGKYVLDLQPDDIFWYTADPGWVTETSYGIIAPLVNGVTTIVDEDEFDALRWYTILEQQKITVWYTSSTAIRRLMHLNIKPLQQFNLESLRLITSVGEEPLHAEAVLWGERTFDMPILDNWWQTETGGITIANFPSLEVKPGSMGKAIPGVEAAIAELTEHDIRIIREPNKSGHLVLKKGWPSMFVGYLNEEERYKKCFRGEWYVTGDIARQDEDGYFWFVSRADDIIKTSDRLVGPSEIENVLMNHSSVAEAAVIGKPNSLIGEVVKAFVVLKPGLSPGEEQRLEIMTYARKKLGQAIAPKEISFVDTLPKTKSGKILRHMLKARELGLPKESLSTLER